MKLHFQNPVLPAHPDHPVRIGVLIKCGHAVSGFNKDGNRDYRSDSNQVLTLVVSAQESGTRLGRIHFFSDGGGMASFRPVRAVLRAVRLLQALNGQPVSTIDMLHRQTGMPKPSLVRLLQTLESLGLVRRAPRYGAYYLTSQVTSLASGYHSVPRIVEAGAPVAEALTCSMKWPVAIAVFDSESMVVCYSTIPSSPLSLLHSTINMRLSVVSRALGRAYLAFCTPDERRFILDTVSRSDKPEDRIARDGAAMRRIIAETRRRGYALRDPSVRPVSGTLAVPVFEGKRVVASLGMTWFTSALDSRQAVARYLEPLARAAKDISRSLGTLQSLARRGSPGTALAPGHARRRTAG